MKYVLYKYIFTKYVINIYNKLYYEFKYNMNLYI